MQNREPLYTVSRPHAVQGATGNNLRSASSFKSSRQVRVDASSESKPSVAIFSAHPTSKPTVRVKDVQPAPGSKVRSHLELMRTQNKGPTGGWTASSFHPPSTHGALSNDHCDPAHKDSCEEKTLPHTEYIKNLKEQRDLLGSELQMMRGTTRPPNPKVLRPVVATHSTQLLEDLDKENRTARGNVSEAYAQADQLRNQIGELNKDVFTMRRIATDQKELASKAQLEASEYHKRLEETSTAQRNAEQGVLALEQRMNLVSNELLFSRGELDRTRQQLNMVVLGRNGQLSSNIGLILGPNYTTDDHAALAAAHEGLKGEVAEAKHSIIERDAHIDSLNAQIELFSKDHRDIAASLRHSQQKNQTLQASVDSGNVLLRNATNEVECLRLLTGEQHHSIERLLKEHQEQFGKVKMETEQRLLREAQYASAADGAKTVVHHAGLLMAQLEAEQGTNDQLRKENDSIKEQLRSSTEMVHTLKHRLENIQQNVAHAESSFMQQALELERALSGVASDHVRTSANDKDTFEKANAMLSKMKEIRVAPVAPTPLPASNPVSLTTTPPQHSTYLLSMENEIRQLLETEKKARIDAEEMRKLATNAISQQRVT